MTERKVIFTEVDWVFCFCFFSKITLSSLVSFIFSLALSIV